jgi:hypothetical protein
MDTPTLFKQISRRMQADFEMSAQVQHAGSKGTLREGILRDFLAEGRLPAKYGLGAGEIVGRIRATSKQCDLIVYDKLEGVTLLGDDTTQVYPVDCVYGIVEVKSALSKAEFIDALDKIATFKNMAPADTVIHRLGGMTTSQIRSRPFGMVFAYGLAGNSLESLVENLRAWEQGKDPSLWPNYVCVLGTGTIYHNGQEVFQKAVSSEDLGPGCWPSYLAYGEDSLYQFYCALHDICARMRLGPVELASYYQPHEQIGRFVLKGRINFTRTGDNKTVRFTEAALERAVAWCAERGTISYGEVLMKQLGELPLGMEPTSPYCRQQVFLYDPLGLPGLHELGEEPFVKTDQGVTASRPSLLSIWTIDIDGRSYALSMEAFGPDDFEEWPT